MMVAILLYNRNISKREVFISATLVYKRMLPYFIMLLLITSLVSKVLAYTFQM
jgi:hypothetical protein